jgi:hypothetical protein
MARSVGETRGGRDPRLLAWRAAIAILLLGLAWVSVTATVAGITRRYQPALALRVQPFDALANAEMASSLQLDQQIRSDPNELKRLATEALQRDPTLAQAARVIGILDSLAGNVPAAARAMHYSDRLTHRDLATQLWLIEYNVQRNDVPEILRHFDAAASSSEGAMTLLFPILVQALDHADLVAPMADMLKRDPWWSPSLLMAMAQGTTNVDNVADLFTRLAASGHAPRQEIVDVIAQRLIAAGKADVAARLRAATLAPGSSAPAPAAPAPAAQPNP